MFNEIKPRLAMVTHLSYDEELIPEIIAGIRVHYSGLFQFGAPDVVVVNVTKSAVWTRQAALPEAGNMARPSPNAIGLFDLSPAPIWRSGSRIPGIRSLTCRSLRSANARSIQRSTTRPTCIARHSAISRTVSRSMCARSSNETSAGRKPNSRPSESSNSSTSSRAMKPMDQDADGRLTHSHATSLSG